MESITINLTGSKGLSNKLGTDINRDSSDVNIRYDIADGQMVDGLFNPNVRDGYLYPTNNSFMPLTTSGTLNNIDDFFAVYADYENNNMYFSNQDGEVFNFQATHFDVQFYTYTSYDSPFITLQEATGNAIYDIAKYELNGVKKMFYVNSTSGGNVGVAGETWSGFDNDWISTVADGGTDLNGTGKYAFMRVASNNFLYIFDEYAIHKIDGTTAGGANGIATMNGFVFPQGTFIKDAVDYRGNFYVAFDKVDEGAVTDETLTRSKSKESGVLVWDRILSTFGQTDVIPIEGVSVIQRIWIGYNNTIYLMCISSDGLNQIRKFDGTRFNVIKELPFGSKILVRDSLLVADGVTYWSALDGYIYCLKNDAVFKIAQYESNLDIADGGAVMIYSGGDSFTADTGYNATRPSLSLAYRKSGETNGTFKRFYLHGTGTIVDNNGADGSGAISDLPFNAHAGNVFTGVKLLPNMSTIQRVNIRCAPTGTGSETIATIKYYFNMSSTASITKTITKDDAQRGYVEHELNKQYVNSVQMEIIWDTDLIMGSDDFSPFVAVVDYEPSNTHG